MQDTFSKLYLNAKYTCILLNEKFEIVKYNIFALDNKVHLKYSEKSFFELIEENINLKNQVLNGSGVSMPIFNGAVISSSITYQPFLDGYIVTITPADTKNLINGQRLSSRLRENIGDTFMMLPILAKNATSLIEAEYATNIQRNCYTLLRDVSNLEKLTQLKLPAISITKDVIDMTSLINSLCEGCVTVCKHTNVPMTFDIQKNIFVNANRDLLECAILNIISNSYIYTQDKNEIHVGLTENNENMILTISDKGMGILPEHIEHIFEPYFVAVPYKADERSAYAGLGLTISQQIIHRLGGTILVHSTPYEGTTTTISLPRVPNSEDALSNTSADYLLNKFSSLYIQMCDVCRLPVI